MMKDQLLRLTVKNYKSFKKKTSMEFLKEAWGDAHNYTAIFGANASGKSNFIEALPLLARFVCGKCDVKHIYRPYKKEEPVIFQVTYKVGGVEYEYILMIKGERILRESLYKYVGETRQKDFRRYVLPDSEYYNKSALEEQCPEAYKFFSNLDYSRTNYNQDVVFKNFDYVKEVLKACDMEVVSEKHELTNGQAAVCSLLIGFINAIDKGSVLLVDNLGHCLHPLLVKHLVDHLSKEVQLIFATHTTYILDSANDYDYKQIWFIEKDGDGVSSIFSLDDFEDANLFEDNIQQAYLDGRFGAVPYVDAIN